jgi:hypothetical protein
VVAVPSASAGAQYYIAAYRPYRSPTSGMQPRAVPAAISAMLIAFLAGPVRVRGRVIPTTMKPARVRMFIPKRISLVSSVPSPTAKSLAQGVRCSETASFTTPRVPDGVMAHPSAPQFSSSQAVI